MEYNRVMGIRIGEIEEGDNEQAHEFCLSIFEEMGWPKEFAYGFDNLKDFFSSKREVFFVAKLQEKIVGCAGLKELSKTEALLKRFYIAKDFRGKGVADLMLSKIKEFAKEKNYKTIFLDIFQDNLRAKRFFQKRGFLIFKPVPNELWSESKHPKKFEYRKLVL